MLKLDSWGFFGSGVCTVKLSFAAERERFLLIAKEFENMKPQINTDERRLNVSLSKNSFFITQFLNGFPSLFQPDHFAIQLLFRVDDMKN